MKKLTALLLKTAVILALLAGLWQLTQPLDGLNRVSLYNHVFPGRDRLPFGENPRAAYNFSIGSLDAAFASHRISGAGAKDPRTVRTVLIGDSSGWGTLLRPEETLCGNLNGRVLSDGRTVDCYNLAYPTLSLAKDTLILNRVMEYDPDLILWPMTLESFPADKQRDNALVRANFEEYLRLYPGAATETEKAASGRSLWAQRREAADWLRLQLYGLMWAGTGIDQAYPEDHQSPRIDQEPDNTFHGYEGPLPDSALAWDVLETGMEIAGTVPALIINEPMLISDGINSEIRYNYYYPREAYDSWLASLKARADENNWNLLDLHDSLETGNFTNSAIHYDPDGAALLADRVLAEIENVLSHEKP